MNFIVTEIQSFPFVWTKYDRQKMKKINRYLQLQTNARGGNSAQNDQCGAKRAADVRHKKTSNSIILGNKEKENKRLCVPVSLYVLFLVYSSEISLYLITAPEYSSEREGLGQAQTFSDAELCDHTIGDRKPWIFMPLI